MADKLSIEFYDAEGKTTGIVPYETPEAMFAALSPLLQSNETNFEVNIPQDRSDADEIARKALKMFQGASPESQFVTNAPDLAAMLLHS